MGMVCETCGMSQCEPEEQLARNECAPYIWEGCIDRLLQPPRSVLACLNTGEKSYVYLMADSAGMAILMLKVRRTHKKSALSPVHHAKTLL